MNMAHTYRQIYIQIVFATSERVASAPERHTDRVYKHITGIVQAGLRGRKFKWRDPCPAPDGAD